MLYKDFYFIMTRILGSLCKHLIILCNQQTLPIENQKILMIADKPYQLTKTQLQSIKSKTDKGNACFLAVWFARPSHCKQGEGLV